MMKKRVTFETFRDVTYIDSTSQHKEILWWSKDDLLMFKIKLIELLRRLNISLENIQLHTLHKYIHNE